MLKFNDVLKCCVTGDVPSLEHIDHETVEDIFKGVLSQDGAADSGPSQPHLPQPPVGVPTHSPHSQADPGIMGVPGSGPAMSPGHGGQQGGMMHSPHMGPPHSLAGGPLPGMPGPPPHHPPHIGPHGMHPMQGHPPPIDAMAGEYPPSSLAGRMPPRSFPPEFMPHAYG